MGQLSISRAWDETRAFLARETRLVAPVALAAFAIPATLANWHVPYGTQAPAGGAGLGLLFFLLMLVLGAIGQMTIAVLAVEWRGSLGDALRLAARRVWGVIAALLIVTLPVVLVGSLILGVTLISSGITDPASLTPQLIQEHPGILLPLMLMMLALVFIFVRLAPIHPVAMVEGARPLFLISRSWALTKGSFWRLLAVVMLFGVAALVLDWTISAVLGSILAIAMGPPTSFSLAALLVALVAALAGAMVSAVMASMYGRIYAQLSAARPGVPDVQREE